jgi:hypothetical protein
MACGIEKPSKTGTACVTPSPESRTIPVVRPDEYLLKLIIGIQIWAGNGIKATHSDNTACTDINNAGTLKVSKKIWAA